MAGIVKQAMEQPTPDEGAPPAPQDAAPAVDAADESQGEAATPEEQEAFDRAVAVATKAMTSAGAMDRMLALVKQAGIEQGIAQTVSAVVEQVDKRLDIPEQVIIGFATEVTTIAWAGCARARLVREDDHEKMSSVLQAVYSALAQQYEFDPQEAAAMIEQMEASNGTDL